MTDGQAAIDEVATIDAAYATDAAQGMGVDVVVTERVVTHDQDHVSADTLAEPDETPPVIMLATCQAQVADTAAPTLAPADDDPAWREHWPHKRLHMVVRLLPRASQAPALDGVTHVRMEAELVEEMAGNEVASLDAFPFISCRRLWA